MTESRPTILCCDDDEWILELLKYSLEREYNLILIKHPKEVYTALENNKIDLVVLDINLPKEDGFSILAKIKNKKSLKNTPVVMLTSDGKIETVRKAISAGAFGFIVKPIKPVSIQTKIREYISSSRAINIIKETDKRLKKIEQEPITHKKKIQYKEAPAKEFIDIINSLEKKLISEDTFNEGIHSILKILSKIFKVKNIAFFIKEFSTENFKLASSLNLDELEKVIEIFLENKEDILHTFKLSRKKQYFRFKNFKYNEHWFAYGLKVRSNLVGIILIKEENDEILENLINNETLQLHIKIFSYLIDDYKQSETSKQILISVSKAFSESLDAKDPYTRGHTERVTLYALVMNAVSQKYLPEYYIPETELRLAGFLHDIGKIGIPESILCKRDKLTKEEYEIMKTHVTIGRKMLIDIPELKIALDGTLHHERYDGRGYPYGFAGEQIPLVARYLAPADTFDAMTSNRPYRKGLDPEIALKEIVKGAGTQFDPIMCELFEKAYKEGLVRSILDLNTIYDEEQKQAKDQQPDTKVSKFEKTQDFKLCEKLFSRIDQIKFGSPIVQELLGLIDDPEISIKEIGNRIKTDTTLTTKILQVANSSYYGFSKRIINVEQGIVILGLKEVKNMLYKFNLSSLFNRVKLEKFDIKKLWVHSLVVALISKYLSVNYSKKSVAEDAFLSGLMHDIGKLALLNLYPKRYEKIISYVIRNQNISFKEIEEKEFGISHDRAAAYLINKWHLPIFLEEPLAYHHSEREINQEDKNQLLSVIVKIADDLSFRTELALKTDYPLLSLDNSAYKILGINEDNLQNVLEDVNVLLEKNIQFINEF